MRFMVTSHGEVLAGGTVGVRAECAVPPLSFGDIVR